MPTHLQTLFPHTTTPFICSAPMRQISTPSLAVNISKSGGLGFLGIGYDLTQLTSSLQFCRDFFPSSSHPIQSIQPILPIGLGLILWNLPAQSHLETIIQHILEYKPCAVWLFAPASQEQLETWILGIKETASWCRVFVQIGSCEEVELLLKGRAGDGVDVIVAQGVADSGGHGRERGGSVLTLVPEVVDLVKRLDGESDGEPDGEKRRKVAVIAAGGIVDGRGVAASLMLGAEGVALGTRFVASSEAETSDSVKKYILNAKDGGRNTVRTRLYDTLRGTNGWPSHYNGRAIINTSFHDHTQHNVSEEENRKRYQKAVEENDAERLTVYAGTGVGLIHDIRPAAEIFRGVQQEAREILGSASSKL